MSPLKFQLPIHNKRFVGQKYIQQKSDFTPLMTHELMQVCNVTQQQNRLMHVLHAARSTDYKTGYTKWPQMSLLC